MNKKALLSIVLFNGFVDLWQYSDFVILLTEPII